MLQVTKLIIYMAVLFFISYSYGSITKDTIFDNFFIMLLSLFVFIFIIEAIFAALKKKYQPKKTNKETKDDDPESWDAIMEEVKKDFEKSWDINYENHKLHIVNKYNAEQLFINEKLVDESKRMHWYSWIIPFQTLKGEIKHQNDALPVKVKLGGWFSLNCKVYVNKKLIFKQKLKYDVISGGFKEED